MISQNYGHVERMAGKLSSVGIRLPLEWRRHLRPENFLLNNGAADLPCLVDAVGALFVSLSLVLLSLLPPYSISRL